MSSKYKAQKNTENLQKTRRGYEALIQKTKDEIQHHPGDQSIEEKLIDSYLEYADLLQRIEEGVEQIKESYDAAIQIAQAHLTHAPADIQKKATLSKVYVQYIAFLKAGHQENEAACIVDHALQWDLPFFSQLSKEVPTDSLLVAKAVLTEFAAEKVITLEMVQELVAQSRATNDTNFYREITKTFLKRLELDKNTLLDLRLLQGLMVVLFQRADWVKDEPFAADCSVLLKAITVGLQEIPIDQNLLQIEALLPMVCTLLDQMVSVAIKDIDYVRIYVPLLIALSRFKNTPYAYINWTAAYAEQALLRIPHNESFRKKIARHIGSVTTGLLHLMGGIFEIFASGIASLSIKIIPILVIKSLEQFLNALRNFKRVYKNFSFRRAQLWYTELHNIDLGLTKVDVTKRLNLLRDYLNTPKKRYKDTLLQGICDRVGRLACAADLSVQEKALRLLKNVAQDGSNWNKSEAIKDHAGAVLRQLAQWQNIRIRKQRPYYQAMVSRWQDAPP